MERFFDLLEVAFSQMWPIFIIWDVGRYLVFAGAMALVLWLFQSLLSGRRIQSRRATGEDIRREILLSLRTGVIFSLVGLGIWLAEQYQLLQIYNDINAYPTVWYWMSLVLIIVAHDGYFYWSHRAMHHPKLYKAFHRSHHRSVAPTPWAAYAFDVPEALVMAAFVPLWLLIVPTHPSVIGLFMIFMLARNVMGHAGYEIHPRTMAASRWFGWINSTTHHDQHHATMKYNFGLYFTWWDRWMGTEHPHYLEVAGAQIPQRKSSLTINNPGSVETAMSK